MSDGFATTVIDFIRRRTADEVARLAAYVLAPSCVLLGAASTVWSPGLAVDLSQPLVISSLRSRLDATGGVTASTGAAIIVEPVESEFRIPFAQGRGALWTSLDTELVRANAGRLTNSMGEVVLRPPFLGTSEPVAIVVEGDLAGRIDVPGGSQPIDLLKLQSRRSVSLVSSVLLCSALAFGMAIAGGLPFEREQNR